MPSESRGATGKFPQGKIHSSDEGELNIEARFDAATGTLVLHFGKAVTWIGMDAREAREFGATILRIADAMEKEGY